MKQSLIAGVAVNEYLLVLLPHKDLYEKIRRIKQDFSQKFRVSIARATEPQLMLARFSALAEREGPLINRLGTILAGATPFQVELRGFGCLPSHTIYFNVATRQPIDGLVRQVREARSLMLTAKEQAPFFFEEHRITLCHKLRPWQYEEAWKQYAGLDFSGHFVTTHAHLLRRQPGEKYFHSGTAIPLLGKATIHQGALFS